MSKVFIPVAWLMGVPASECELVGNLVALKSIVNEFAAYSKLSEYISKGMISVLTIHLLQLTIFVKFNV